MIKSMSCGGDMSFGWLGNWMLVPPVPNGGLECYISFEMA